MAVEERRAALVASRLTPWLIELFHDADAVSVPPALRLDADKRESVALRTLHSLTEDEKLAALLHGSTRNGEEIEARLCELMRERRDEVRSADLLWATLAGEWPVESGGEAASTAARKRALRPGGRFKERLQRSWAAVSLSAVIGAVLIAAERYAATWAWPGSLTLIELFAVAILSFFPGWLFVRFIGFRAGAVWDEYVLNLHRLGVDEPQHLPRPPINSVYYGGWVAAGGPLLGRQPTIYQQKFDAYYGRSVSRSGGGMVKVEALFPLFLFTAVVATGWTAVLGQADVLTGGPRPDAYSTLDVMAFAFLGAYAFTVQMLVRRYFQADLKASAYAASFVRITVAVGIVAVAHRAGLLLWDGTVQAAVAFVIGSFPLVGVQLLHRAVTRVARVAVPVLDFPHPLSDLEGLSIWYEARLLEEGIEDMQNLLTANLPEVILHTRVPVGRLVDWIDQAHLYLRLPPLSKADRKDRLTSKHLRCVLHRVGVRDASGFLDAFPLDDHGALRPVGATSVDAVQSAGMSAAQVATISRIVDADPGMETVWRWRCWKSCLPENGSGFRNGRAHHHRHEPKTEAKKPVAAG
ncbi:MAG: hypothetical protein KY443_07925 [Actinobacteria bacterium]|nr:hypothetical protein [Actinomycetota bacterium]